MRLRIFCPAKVNLFLSVGPADPKGYHPLRTIFQAIGLFDVLEIEFTQGSASSAPRLEVIGVELPAENTVTKALRLGREVFDLETTAIRLEKRIPMQAGLGGGSSNAAGVLRAMQRVRPVPKAEIDAIASAIGADVPFFLTGGRARGTGFGDRIEPLPDPEPEWYVVARPPVGCSTPEMYARLDGVARDWRDWPTGDRLYNDFQLVAPRECLELIERLLTLGARDAALCGSGSAVFGRFSEAGNAEAATRLLATEKPEIRTWAAKTLGRADSLTIEPL